MPIPSQFIYAVTYILIVAVLSLCVMALLVSRQLRIVAERRDVYNENKPEKKSSLLRKAVDNLREIVRKAVEGSGVKISLNEFMSIWFACVAVPPLLGLVMGVDPAAAAVLLLPGAVGPIFVLHTIKKANEKKFEEMLGQTMPLIASNLRGGAMLSQAIRPVAENMDDPIRGEFEILRRDMDRGMPVDEAIDKMAERNNSSDLRLFASAVRAQMKTGGSLADIVDSVGRTIQQRCELRQMVRSKTSQAKFMAKLMVAVPPLLGLVFFFGNETYRNFYASAMGLLTIAACAVLEGIGYFVANKMCDIKPD